MNTKNNFNHKVYIIGIAVIVDMQMLATSVKKRPSNQRITTKV